MFVYVWQVQVREFAALIILLGGFFSFKQFLLCFFVFFFSVILGGFPFSYRPQCPLLYKIVCSVLNYTKHTLP